LQTELKGFAFNYNMSQKISVLGESGSDSGGLISLRHS